MIIKKAEEVFLLFKEKKYHTAFFGDEDFFLKDPLWGDHNSLAIFLHFVTWAKNENPREEDILVFFLDELQNNRARSRVDGNLSSLLVLRDYCQAAQIKDYWPLSKELVLYILTKINHTFTHKEIREYGIPKCLQSFLPIIPEVQDIISSIQK